MNNQNHNSFEEDDDWIPLSPGSYADDDNNGAGTSKSTAVITRTSPNRRHGRYAHSLPPLPTQMRPVSSSLPCSAPASGGSTNLSADLQRIKDHHERNQSLKKHLINQPLSRFPSVFVSHLAREIWVSHYYIRLGESSSSLWLGERSFFLFSILCAEIF